MTLNFRLWFHFCYLLSRGSLNSPIVELVQRLSLEAAFTSWLLMARAAARDIADRIDQLQGVILAGHCPTAFLVYARQTWGVSRAQV